jgi:DNA-binding beta-propeller fold protein YncE
MVALAACAEQGSGNGNGDGGLPPFTNGVSTLSGSSEPGFVDGARGTARFSNPVNVAFGPDGKIYVADFDNGKIRVVTSDGTTSTLIAQKGFARPFGLAFAGSTLYVTTDNNNTGRHVIGKSGSVWKVGPGQTTATEIIDSIGMPRGIAVLSDGRLALADYENHVIELLDPSSAQLTVLAGAFGSAGFVDAAGGAARFAAPTAILQRGDGKLVVVDTNNNLLRTVGADGSVTTMAGTGQSGFADGAMTTGMFNKPEGITQDKNGVLYIADTGNHRVRRINGSTLDTIAGDGNAGWSDNDDPHQAEFFGLEGLSVTPDGSMVYVADGNRGENQPHNFIRQIKL